MGVGVPRGIHDNGFTWKVTAVITSLQSVNLRAFVTYSRGGDATKAERLSVNTNCWKVPA